MLMQDLCSVQCRLFCQNIFNFSKLILFHQWQKTISFRFVYLSTSHNLYFLVFTPIKEFFTLSTESEYFCHLWSELTAACPQLVPMLHIDQRRLFLLKDFNSNNLPGAYNPVSGDGSEACSPVGSRSHKQNNSQLSQRASDAVSGETSMVALPAANQQHQLHKAKEAFAVK